MIFAYIYNLITWGQSTKKHRENVKETRAYHWDICLAQDILLLDNLNLIPREQ